MAGYDLLYYNVVRISDGWVPIEGFTSGSDNIESFMKYLEWDVDDIICHPKEWEDPLYEEE